MFMRMRVVSFTYICANPELYSFGEGNWFQFFVAYINPNSLLTKGCARKRRGVYLLVGCESKQSLSLTNYL